MSIARSYLLRVAGGRYHRDPTVDALVNRKKVSVSKYETSVLLKSDLPGMHLVASGKVRDIYAAGEHLLFIASDRISAFDVVLPNGIPRKGEVLTKLSMFWFDFLKDVLPAHFVTADVDE